MTRPSPAELDEAVRTATALVEQIDTNPQMVVDVVDGLTINELRTVIIALASATARIVRDGF